MAIPDSWISVADLKSSAQNGGSFSDRTRMILRRETGQPEHTDGPLHT